MLCVLVACVSACGPPPPPPPPPAWNPWVVPYTVSRGLFRCRPSLLIEGVSYMGSDDGWCACLADKRNCARCRLREPRASSSWQMTILCRLTLCGRTLTAIAAAKLAIRRPLCTWHCNAAMRACRFLHAGIFHVLNSWRAEAPGMQPFPAVVLPTVKSHMPVLK